MRVVRWGDGLAVRIPEGVGLREGDEVEVRAAGARAIGVAREALLRGLREFRGRLPEGFRFDRDKANAR